MDDTVGSEGTLYVMTTDAGMMSVCANWAELAVENRVHRKMWTKSNSTNTSDVASKAALCIQHGKHSSCEPDSILIACIRPTTN